MTSINKASYEKFDFTNKYKKNDLQRNNEFDITAKKIHLIILRKVKE